MGLAPHTGGPLRASSSRLHCSRVRRNSGEPGSAPTLGKCRCGVAAVPLQRRCAAPLAASGTVCFRSISALAACCLKHCETTLVSKQMRGQKRREKHRGEISQSQRRRPTAAGGAPACAAKGEREGGGAGGQRCTPGGQWCRPSPSCRRKSKGSTGESRYLTHRQTGAPHRPRPASWRCCHLSRLRRCLPAGG